MSCLIAGSGDMRKWALTSVKKSTTTSVSPAASMYAWKESLFSSVSPAAASLLLTGVDTAAAAPAELPSADSDKRSFQCLMI
jgi:hypothetical protein